MRVPPRDLLTVALALVTLTIATVAGAGMASYSEFFPTLSGLQATLTSLNWQIINATSDIQLIKLTNVTFTILNPTDYKGLELRGFQPSLDIYSPSANTTISQSGFPVLITIGPLDPGHPIQVKFQDYNVTQDAVFLWRQRHDIQFVFFNDFTLSSFLNHVGPIKVTYKCASSGEAQPCQQAGITVQTSGLPSTGRGA